MAVTRINNNQITDASAGNVYLGINANTKLQNYSITSQKIANNLTYGSDLTVTGNLTVQGTTTAVDTVNTLILDPLITLADGQTSGVPTVDIGTIGLRGSQLSAVFAWIEADKEFAPILSNTTISNTTVNINAYANLHMGNATVQGTTSLIGNVIGTNTNFSGNITAGNVVATGTITATNFIGNISGNIDAAGSNTQVQFNDTGDILGATSGFTFDKTANLVTVGGNVNATNFNGNVFGTSVSASGTVTSASTVGGVITGSSSSVTGTQTAASTVGGVITGSSSSVTGTQTAASTVGGVITGSSSSVTGTQTAASTVGGVITGSSSSVTGTQTAASTVGGVITGSSASVTGNITGANLVVTTNIYDATALNIVTGAGNLNLQPAGNIVVNNTYINGLQLNPQQDADAASKYYVDNLVTTAISYHEAVTAATNTTLATATGGTITYAQPNGVANGVGATLTTTGSFNLIDTANVQTVGTRILVKDQANAVQNGIYVWSNATVITRSSDADIYGPASANTFSINDYFFVTSGNVNAGSAWIVDEPAGVITFGASNIFFAQFSQSQVYSANTSAGLILNGTVFSTKVDNNTTAFDGGGNISVKAGANLTTPNIGAATGTSLSVTGTVTAASTVGGVITGTSASLSGNTTAGNVQTGGLISATGNVTGGNILTGGLISATGNVTAANFFGNIVGNVDAAGSNTQVQFNDTGDILGATSGFTFDKTANLLTVGGQITSTGAGNTATDGGQIFLNGATLNRIDWNTNGTGAPAYTTRSAGAKVVLYPSISGSATDYALGVEAGALWSGIPGNDAGQFFKWYGGNVPVANLSGTGVFSAVGNVSSGGNISATGNITGANLALTSGIIDGPAAGRITINGSDIDTDFAVDGDTLANVFYVDAGTGTASFGSSTQVTNAIVNFDTTTSFKAPVGNTAQRPAIGVTGMVRFNTTNNNLELYDNTQWIAVGVPEFTVIADQQFNGDGTTVAFTLSSTQTTNSCIVSINGVVQIPTLAYSVSGTDPTCVLTFTEAPAPGDIIDVRQITTTTSVTSIANSSGNAVVAVSDTSATTTITGDLTVTGNATILGNVATDLIQNGTSRIEIPDANGNLHFDVNGANDVLNIGQFNSVFSGNILPQANVTYDLGTSTKRWKDLYLANSTIYLGNAQISANATAIIMTNPAGGQTVLSGASPAITGATVSVTGNVTGGNILTGGLISVTGNITGGNLSVGSGTVTLGGIVNGSANATGNIGSATSYFNTVFAKATSAQYADLAEKYAADADYAPGTVVQFGGSAEVTLCVSDACSRVAGVISTNPSYRMNDGLVSAHTAMVALTGRVPTRVTGTVRKGDMMVSAGDGVARAEADPAVGTVIGKALADSEGDAVIEVVVGRV